MAVAMRLKRTGARNKPCYRIVVMDKRSQRDGRAIEELGYYDPLHCDEKIKLERAEYWLSTGAQPSETVTSIVERARSGAKLTPPKPGKSKKRLAKEAEAKEKAAESETAKPDEPEKAAEEKAEPEKAD